MAFPRCEHRLVLKPKSHDPFQKVKGIEKGRNEIIHLFFRAQVSAISIAARQKKDVEYFYGSIMCPSKLLHNKRR